MKKQYRILIPSNYNDGTDIPWTVTEHVQKELLNTFGGFTITPNLIGGWLDKGITYCDRMNAYDIASDSANLVRIAARTIGAELCQHAMYVEFPNSIVEIIDIPA